MRVTFSCEMCGEIKSGFTQPYDKEEWSEAAKDYTTPYGAIFPQPAAFIIASTGVSHTLCRPCHDKLAETVEHIIRGERILQGEKP